MSTINKPTNKHKAQMVPLALWSPNYDCHWELISVEACNYYPIFMAQGSQSRKED